MLLSNNSDTFTFIPTPLSTLMEREREWKWIKIILRCFYKKKKIHHIKQTTKRMILISLKMITLFSQRGSKWIGPPRPIEQDLIDKYIAKARVKVNIHMWR